MRTAVLGLMVTVGLVFLVAGVCAQRNPVFAQFPADLPTYQTQKNDKLIAFSVPAGETRQQITLIDPAARSMSVYHIDTDTGAITLKSVRRFHWDLEMEEFNGVEPTPREIRSLIEQR
jgi:hypothetical protein